MNKLAQLTSGLSPFTCRTGAQILLAKSVQYWVWRPLSPGVVNPTYDYNL